jgi:hypothetical protein
MSVPTKLCAFLLTLGGVFAGAYGAGTLTGPVGASDAAGHPMATGNTAAGHDTPGGYRAEEASSSGPGGLAVSADGYTLRPLGGNPRPGTPGEFAFQIVDAHAAPVTRFQTNHDKQLHLIVVRRDLTGFQHLHPQMSPDGTWRTPLTLAEAGDWRVFADFLPDGSDRQIILGVDMPVAGSYRPQPLPEPAPTASIDGYTVSVHGHLVAGRTSRLTLTVSAGGVPVNDLQPYLGAYGHLVALRAGDLAYLHVHPQQTTTAGPAIAFDVEVPTAGAYRLFLDFQHDGVVRTAQFTASAT